MVIGAGGARLKTIATKARLDMEKLFGGKVHLEVWVKVKSGWTDNQQLLHDSAMPDRGKSRQDSQPASCCTAIPTAKRAWSSNLSPATPAAWRWSRAARAGPRRCCAACCSLSSRCSELGRQDASCERSIRAEWQGGLPQLKGRGLLCGFYLNELMVKLLAREDPHEQLFETYDGTLRALAAGGDHAAILRRFEKRFLQELGYALTLDRDAESGEAILPVPRIVIGRPRAGALQWEQRGKPDRIARTDPARPRARRLFQSGHHAAKQGVDAHVAQSLSRQSNAQHAAALEGPAAAMISCVETRRAAEPEQVSGCRRRAAP
jgi:hypothetical protein